MGSKPVKISASRGASILGFNPWASPVDIWLQIMSEQYPGFADECNFDIPVVEENAAMRWGTAFEDAVIGLAEAKRGSWIVELEKFFETDDGICTCHIDGRYTEMVMSVHDGVPLGPPRKILHEGKTTTAWNHREEWGEPGTDRIPIQYQIQVQHQMLCTGAYECIVSVLVFPKRQSEWEDMGITPDPVSCIHWARTLYELGFFHQYPIPRNDELIEKMSASYLDWWEKYIVGQTPPPPRSYQDIRRLVTAPTGTIVATEQLERWSAEYKQIGKEVSELGKRRDELKTLMLDRMRELDATMDGEAADKWILRDRRGRKLHQYGKKGFR